MLVGGVDLVLFAVEHVEGSNVCDTWQKCSLCGKTFASWVRLGMRNLLPTDMTILGEGHTWDFELLIQSEVLVLLMHQEECCNGDPLRDIHQAKQW